MKSSKATANSAPLQNKYHEPVDYGQFDHKARREEYNVYMKQREDYDQYCQEEEDPDQYYYGADDYNQNGDEQDEQENNKENNQSNESFEDVPNVKKATDKPNPKQQMTYNPKKSVQPSAAQQELDDQDDQENNQLEASEDDQKQKSVQQLAKPILKATSSKQETSSSSQKPPLNIKQKEITHDEDEYDDNEDDEAEAETTTKRSDASKAKESKNSGSSNYLRSTRSFDTKASLRQEEKQNSSAMEPFDNVYNTKKYPLGIVDDPDLEDERKNLWKAFGRECAAGKELFSLYRSHQPPKIAYPKLKMKTPEELAAASKPNKEVKSCPQKTQILYPPLSYKEVKPRYHKVDLIPKRKPEAEIRKELEDLQRNPYVPMNRGVNRKDMIEKLQMKFKNLRGGLPKAAELPYIDENKMVYNEDMIKTQASKRVGMKYKTFAGQIKDSRMEDETIKSNFEDPVAECNYLFDQIMQEIEERQEFLDSITHLKEVNLKKKIKQEIIERVAELQKVTEIKQKYL